MCGQFIRPQMKHEREGFRCNVMRSMDYELPETDTAESNIKTCSFLLIQYDHSSMRHISKGY